MYLCSLVGAKVDQITTTFSNSYSQTRGREVYFVGWYLSELLLSFGMCFARIDIHFFTSARLVFFNFLFDECFVFGPRGLPIFSRKFLFHARCFCDGAFSFYFLLFSVRLFLRSIILFSPLTFFGQQIIGFLLYSWRWFFSTAPFISRTSSRRSPAALFCFASRFLLSSDWLPFVPRTSSRPSPVALFCFAPEFSLLPIDFLLFRALVPGRHAPALFVQRSEFHGFHARILLSRAPFRFILPLIFFCLIARCLLSSTFFEQ